MPSFQIDRDSSSEYLGLNNLNLSSTEPRKYIKRDRPRSIAAIDSKHIVPLNHTSSSEPGLTDLSGIISPPVEKRVKIKTPVNDRKNNSTKSQNGEEWTEISLNNSPDEVYYRNDVYSDEEDQIPYKPLPMDLSPEAAQAVNATVEPPKEQTNRKRLVTQKSLPTMSKVNEVTLSEEKKAEVTRSPSVKSRSKLDSSLANWITRSSAGGEASGGSSSKWINASSKNFIP
jgi:SH3-domain binding protein 5